MAKIQIKKGTTSKLLDIFIQDSSSTTGAGLTGLVWNSAGLTAYYYREGAASATAITLATMTLGTWATGGFVVVDGTNMPGCYQLGIPDAAIATGANSVIVLLKGATNMAPLVLEVQLTDIDLHDSVRGGMTVLPASGTLAVNPTLAAVTHTGAVIPTVSTLTGHTAQTGDVFARLGAPAGASVSADILVIDNFVDELETRLTAVRAGYLDNLSAGAAALEATAQAILTDTAVIGAAGAGLTAIPWNIAWDAEVQSECTDALNVYDPPTKAEMDTAFTEIKGATWSSVTDTLEALRDRGDAAWITATGFSTHTAADTWAVATRTLTAGTNIVLAKGAGVTGFNDIAATDVWASATRTLTSDEGGVKKNTTLNNFEFLMVDSIDNKTGKTGLVITATRSINGAAFGACANAVSEVSNGIYKINLANTDLNGDIITFRFAATGANDRLITIKTVV